MNITYHVNNPVLKDLPGMSALEINSQRRGQSEYPYLALSKPNLYESVRGFFNKGLMNVQDINTLNLSMKKYTGALMKIKAKLLKWI